MYPELLNHYALYPLNLQLIITFALMVRFEHMTRHFICLNLKICLISFSVDQTVKNTIGLKP
jgi:hypothetical protein